MKSKIRSHTLRYVKYLLASMLPFIALNAKGLNLGFDDVSGAFSMASEQFGSYIYSENGMTLTPMESSSTPIIRQGTSCGYASSGSARSPCTNDGSPHFLTATANETYEATWNDGEAFDLISVELTHYSWSPNTYTRPRSFTFVGHLMSGGSVSQTFTIDTINTSDPYDDIDDFETFFFNSDFVNLSSFGINSGGYALDNLNFQAAVPEPASLSLICIFVGGIYYTRRFFPAV